MSDTQVTTNTNLWTGYKVAKVTNQELTKVGLKDIPAQMVYQYIAKGYIESQSVNGQNLVKDTVAAKWIARYIERRKESSVREVGVVLDMKAAFPFSAPLK